MNKLNYPLKVLLIATVVSLLPVTLGVSPLDYKGSSLEAAEDDTKKKKKRRRTKLPSKKMQRILQTIVPFIEAEQWQEALLAMEPVAMPDSKFTSTDRAKMYYYPDLETTADGTKGESEGRDQREKAFLRVDDKK
jgi:hypothetical protein